MNLFEQMAESSRNVARGSIDATYIVTVKTFSGTFQREVSAKNAPSAIGEIVKTLVDNGSVTVTARRKT
jgi:hypothetical protein